MTAQEAFDLVKQGRKIKLARDMYGDGYLHIELSITPNNKLIPGIEEHTGFTFNSGKSENVHKNFLISSDAIFTSKEINNKDTYISTSMFKYYSYTDNKSDKVGKSYEFVKVYPNGSKIPLNLTRYEWESKDWCVIEDEDCFDFSEALKLLKEGKALCRSGWNGKNMHIYLEEHLSFTIGDGVFKGHTRKYKPAIVMYTADSHHQLGWAPSQADMLAEDWKIKKLI